MGSSASVNGSKKLTIPSEMPDYFLLSWISIDSG
jgi:hypothetical protein